MFEALLYYLYTGEIDFASFCSDKGSCYVREWRSWEMGDRPKVSPKSIYRLADKVNDPPLSVSYTKSLSKYDIPELKQLAWEKILEGLDSCDLVEKIFSGFTFL